MHHSVIVVFVQLAVVGDVFPQQLVDAALETNGLDEQIGDGLVVALHYFLDLACVGWGLRFLRS